MSRPLNSLTLVKESSEYALNKAFYNSIRHTLADGTWYLIDEQKIKAESRNKEDVITAACKLLTDDYVFVHHGMPLETFSVPGFELSK